MISPARIEAAARAMYQDEGSFGDERCPWDDLARAMGHEEATAVQDNFRSMASAALAAAFPELAAGTHWLAPVEATEAMEKAYFAEMNNDVFEDWTAMRVAYLEDYPE